MAKENQSGQMLLIVVLTMIVALTVGLSLVSRTITNLRLSRQNEESQRAFQAAEAGIQQVLEKGTIGESGEFSFANNKATFKSEAADVGNDDSFILNGNDPVDQGTGIDIWLSTYPNFADPLPKPPDTSASITVYWSADEEQQLCSTTSGPKVVPAIEIVMLVALSSTSYSVDSPALRKYFYEPCVAPYDRVQADVANTNVLSVDGTPFKYNATINIPAGERGIIMKVIPYFNSTKVAVSSDVELPLQGKVINSLGTAGETARRVTYFSSHPQVPPEIFPYSVLSQ